MAIPAHKWGRSGTVPTDSLPKKELYIHHTVSPDTPRNKAQEAAHLRQLQAGHHARGFSTIGYSFICFRSGRLYEGRGVKGLPAAQGGRNSGTIAIAYVANLEESKMTLRAKLRIIAAAVRLRVRHGVRFRGGHREAPGLRESTACPGRGGLRFVHGSLRRTGLVHVSKRFSTATARGDDLDAHEVLEGPEGSACC